MFLMNKHFFFNLPLLESFIWEVLRYSSLAGINFPHSASEDTTIGGYFIPAV